MLNSEVDEERADAANLKEPAGSHDSRVDDVALVNDAHAKVDDIFTQIDDDLNANNDWAHLWRKHTQLQS